MPANKKAASTAEGDSRQKTPGSNRTSVGARMASRNSGFRTADAHGSFIPPNESSFTSETAYVETPKSSQRTAQPRVFYQTPKPAKSSTSPKGTSRNNQKSSSPENGSLSFGPLVPSDAMDDVCFRFLYNIPEYEQNDQIRVCFQLEQAHWYYVDFYCDNPSYPECKNLRFHEFARQVFYNCDFLLKWRHCVDDVLDQFRYYKSNVPTYGAILLDESLNHILLVQGYFASKNSWGFPKGKVNQNEDPVACAIREVMEETGYDITDKIVPNRVFQYFINDTLVRLYVVKGVEMNFPFEPHLRKEIRKISWFSVWDLPKDRSDEESCARLGLGPNNLYTVLPFVNDIQAFVRREQEKRQGSSARVQIGPKSSSAFQPVVRKAENAVAQKSYLDSMFSSERGPWAGQSPSAQTVHQSGFSGVNTGAGNESVFKPLMVDAGSQPTSFTGQGFLDMIRASTSSQSALLHNPGVIGGEVHNKRKDIQVPKPIHRSRPILTVYEAPKEPQTKPDSGQLTAQPVSFMTELNTSPRLLTNQIFEAPTGSSSKTEIANMLMSTVTSKEARHPGDSESPSAAYLCLDNIANSGVRRKNRQKRRKSTRKSMCTDTEEGENADEDAGTSSATSKDAYYDPSPRSSTPKFPRGHEQAIGTAQQAIQAHDQGIPAALCHLFGSATPQASVGNLASAQRGTYPLFSPVVASPFTSMPPVLNLDAPVATRFPMDVMRAATMPTANQRCVLGSAQETHRLARIFSASSAHNGPLHATALKPAVLASDPAQSTTSLTSVQSVQANNSAPVIQLCEAWKSFKLDRSKLGALCA